MTASSDSARALEWVLGKIAAKKAPSIAPAAIAAPRLVSPAEKQKKMRETRSKEMEIFHLWRGEKDPEKKQDHYENLLKSHMPLLQKRLNELKGSEVNKTANKITAIQIYRNALETFDPKQGTQLHSWITTNLKQLYRYNLQHQNIARIPESVAKHIGTYNSAVAELTQKFGYEPTTKQVAEHTKIPEKMVRQLEQQLRSSFDAEGGGEEATGTSYHVPETLRTIARVVYPTLKPHEQKVMDLWLPRDQGRPSITDTSQIAKKLGWHDTKVSKAKTSILKKMDEYRD